MKNPFLFFYENNLVFLFFLSRKIGQKERKIYNESIRMI
jgi:hypothetical protein